MKKFSILEEKIAILAQIYELLGKVEVKGDSVEHIYASRMLIKQVVESVREIKEGETGEKEQQEKEE